MRKASTRLLEQGIQAPSPAPDLIPAENKTSTENLHWDWYSKRGHFSTDLAPLLLICAFKVPGDGAPANSLRKLDGIG
jgi:hypothetical protein